MGRVVLLFFSLVTTFLLAQCEDPYVYHTWDVKYATLSPLGVPQKVITINGAFPGPTINCTSNNNIVVNVFNNLDEPLLFTWNGIQQRKNSWQEGTLGTTCPILPGTNFTYHFQVKDQIGSYFYYPTTSLHRAAGGYGLISIHSRDLIPVPFDTPEGDFAVFVGDWYTKSPETLKSSLDAGKSLGRPAGLLINGKNGNDNVPMFTMKQGKTYRYRFCNVGLKDSVNVRFQGHIMKLVEVEGSHTMQNMYDSLDVHLGQCYSVLVTADQAPQDYFLVASTRFTKKDLSVNALIRYEGGVEGPPSAVLPPPPPAGSAWSINQFRSFRWNLTASAARPNPQGSYHYGKINITRTIKLAMEAGVKVGGKRRFAVNGVSHVDDTETPLKLAEYYGLADKVFQYNIMKDEPSANTTEVIVAPNVINGTFRNFVEIIFENHDKSIQTWHLAGYSFFAVAVEPGRWSPDSRNQYNLIDALSRNTIQVYPNSWAAVMTTLDNAGMWNLRSVSLERQYLGEQLYISVLSPGRSLRDEYNIFPETLVCGLVKDLPKPAPYSGT
ncbi:l-ascorbate oxidase homolog [Phtheirospermum japonicum]|uniref:L-ascorbate oxidase homolog n=1 Tax=Phtheirospermum japonicum TaxID=374723 RepID=A0A830BTH2_9LAMI|nr:l-ascorbate oxidase homolog [Phtheirospermum japonicum]